MIERYIVDLDTEKSEVSVILTLPHCQETVKSKSLQELHVIAKELARSYKKLLASVRAEAKESMQKDLFQPS